MQADATSPPQHPPKIVHLSKYITPIDHKDTNNQLPNTPTASSHGPPKDSLLLPDTSALAPKATASDSTTPTQLSASAPPFTPCTKYFHLDPSSPSFSPVIPQDASEIVRTKTNCRPHSSHEYPFSTARARSLQNPGQEATRNTYLPQAPKKPHAPIPLSKILSHPLLSETRDAPAHVAKAFAKAEPCPCRHTPNNIRTAGRSAHQANRDLRKALSHRLLQNIKAPAFTSTPPEPDIPRADDLEALMFSFPGLDNLNYDDPPPTEPSDLDLQLWKLLHSRHCPTSPSCTPDIISNECYFKPLFFMLKHGFQAALDPEHADDDIEPHAPAYIHLWNKDYARCKKAFKKLLDSTNFKPIADPPHIFPLLPAYRGKHLWRYSKFGTDYLPRITSDITTSGGNRKFAPWLLRYLGLLAICRVISRGDYLSTRDITGFFNRLPAGELLRSFQCFQDPRSYADSSHANTHKVNSGEASFLQQQSCMFGHKQLPAWASCVSSELARILHHGGARVIGVLIDDLLFHGPAAEGADALQKKMDKVDQTMRNLGLPPNDKGQAPSTRVVFSGILIDTVAGHLSIDEEQREYVLERLGDLLEREHCITKDLESVNGSLGWLCYVIHHGRCRRDVIQRACDTDSHFTPLSRPLRKQLRWWQDILQRRAFHPSPIWFYNEVQRSIRIQSDASGDSGFGFCVANIHVTGCWRASLAHIILNDMFVKELLPPTIAILLLRCILPSYIFGCGLDNAGVTSRINCGSCRSPLGRRLLTVIADALAESEGHILADWNDRDQPLAQHADDLSKILSPGGWASLERPTHPPWMFDLFIHAEGKTIQTSIRIPRLADALPAHLRHRQK